MTALEYHPLANLFPLIEGSDFEEFCAGIKADGILHDKIVLLDGKILDGRNRYRACQATGVTPHFETYNATIHGDPLKFVIGKNLHRRHLDASQRAMVAARLATMRLGDNQHTGEGPSIEEASTALGVGHASVERAREVVDHGTEELQRAVDQGEVAVSTAAEIASLPEAEQTKVLALSEKEIIAKAKEIRDRKQKEKKAKRETRERDLGARQATLPTKRFGVILADPEWRFEPWSRETGLDRAADNHYPTSALDVIRARPVEAIAADDAVLFLWATAPMMPHALLVMASWGFNYVSQAIWAKDRIGTGYWFRNRHELLLVGTRGNIPAPAMGTQWDSVVEAPIGRHSEKPDTFHDLIEAYYPNLPKIELNARRRRPGWEAWGLEAPPEDEDQSRPDPAGMIASIVLNADDRPPSLDIETEGEVPLDQIRATVARWIASHPLAGKFEVVTVNGKTVDLVESDAAPKPLFPAASGIVSAVPAAEEAAPPHAHGAASHLPSPGTPGDNTGGDHEVDRAPPPSAGPPASYSTHDKAPADDALDIPPFLRRGDPDCVVKDREG